MTDAPTSTPRTPVRPSRHWALFYPVAAVAAAGLVALSLGPAPFPPQPGVSAAAAGEAGAFVLGPAALARATPDPWHTIFVARQGVDGVKGFRLALKPGAPPADQQAGVRFSLAPDVAAAMSGKPINATIAITPIRHTGADAVAIGLVGEGPVQWVTAPIGTEPTLQATLPATAGVTALAVRAVSTRQDFASGVELNGITLTPAP